MVTYRIADIEEIVMGLEDIDDAYINDGNDINLAKKYIEAINSIRSILGIEIRINEDDYGN